MTLVELKQKAIKLGLTPEDVREFGHLGKKATWEAAIASHEQSVISNQSPEVPAVDFVPTQPPQTPAPTPEPEEDEDHDESSIDGESVLDTVAEIVARVMGPDVVVKPWLATVGTTFTTDKDIISPPKLATVPDQVECPECGGNGWVYDDNSESGDRVCDCCDGKKIVTPEHYEDWEEYQHSTPEMLTQPIPALTPVAENLPNKFMALTEDSPTICEELRQKMATYVGEVIPPEEFEQLQDEPLDEVTAAILLGLLQASESLEAAVA